MLGNLQNFSVYVNDELQEKKVQASSCREAAELYAAENGIVGTWSMGSSKFLGENGDKIRVKIHYS